MHIWLLPAAKQRYQDAVSLAFCFPSCMLLYSRLLALFIMFFIFLAGVRENFDYTRETIPDGRGASSSGKQILVYESRQFKKS